ncbi:hypothetical protein BBK36DRAFT_1187349 [Trichoderma citrinoviride]|uniref:DUF6604 domain-containing protein n=1 Tax=Trichoderma citrinoviride TaxID=58853 RepID=A0A2T4BJM1_9HYPO|nr:hypothetical protein BBK36DRAFT_1187349 [Trichoderma citrinoviride]PTB69505.1 hypothetical protein BBK36DRAFT_1187349 [Trichoderma citrinoviride]
MRLNSLYVSYKKETGRLLYWLIQTSNNLIQSLDTHDCPLQVNLTGQAPVSDLVSMAKLIAKHHIDIPSKTLALFHSVIELRTICYSQFQELASMCPSEELLESNSKHKYFIDILTEAFHILGGEAWLAEQEEKPANEGEETADGSEEKADARIWTMANRFSVLNLDNDSESGTSHGGENNGEADVDASSSAPPRQQRKKQNGKGKGKKGKGKKPRQGDAQTTGDVPPESYHIIEDDELQQYFMAAYSMAKDWIELRSLLQDFWRRVAYRNLNGAMVAALCNIAVAMIKQSEAVIFGEFPGYESLDMMILTFIHGDAEKAARECRFINNLDDVKGFWESEEMPVDVQETFLINVYDDLVDFINDFQKTRSGKPTKRMLAQLKGWDPYYDLQRATKDERLKWRRSYTINWLYDLVNSVAWRALAGSSKEEKGYVLEDVDWGATGPFKDDKRLFGLFDFAVEVTTLAMQKPGTAFRHRITPHLVFHLQCIIDAWTVSRGWAVSGIRGHVLSEPAPDFDPRRHLDMFLGQGDWMTKGFGFYRGVADLKSLWESFRHSGRAYDDVTTAITLHEELCKEFAEALGNSPLEQTPAVLPSRFATTNPNGLWDYSPFLCGAGLAEGLELSYRCAMVLWDKLRELLLVVYLHGMLSAHQYLKTPLRMFTHLDVMFHNDFFSGEGQPSYDFSSGFPPHTNKHGAREYHRQERLSRRAILSACTTRDFLELFTVKHYKHKSELVLYSKAGWDPDRIPDSDIHHMSALGLIRLSQMSRLYDPATSDWMIAGANLLRSQWPKVHTVEGDVTDDPILESVRKRVDAMKKDIKELTIMPNCIVTPLSWIFDPNKVVNKDPNMTPEMMLSVIWNDLYSDICCEIKPYSSLNYLWITTSVLRFYEEFEEEARTNGTEAVKAMFEETVEDLTVGRDRRVFVSLFALHGTDKDVLETVAKTFEKNDRGVAHLKYFDMERTEEEERGPVIGFERSPCCVM